MAREALTLVLVAAFTLLVLSPSIVPTAEAAPPLVKHIMPLFDRSVGEATEEEVPAAGLDLIYHGGPIQKAPKVYLVFWGWNGEDPAGVAPYLIRFFEGIGGSSYAGMQSEYSSPAQGAITNPTGQLAGVWFDDATLPLKIPDVYIADEARRAVAHFGYSADANYIIATPHLKSTAGFLVQYCAWHSSTPDGFGRSIAYTNLPYIPDGERVVTGCGRNAVNPGAAGALDGVSIVAGHEYVEAATDPLLNAWYDANGAENADKCAWLRTGPGRMQNVVLPTGTFAVQGSWSNAAHGCVIQ